MQALPAATRARLPTGLRNKIKTAHRSWLCQFYYRDPNLHYEVWNLGEARGKLELGLHFESRDHNVNMALLQGFSRRMIEVKATLGPQWEAEQWDRGWTKVYETVPYEPFSDETLAAIAARLAGAIGVLQPIWDSL
jgi:hypothetical protein